MVLKFPRFLRLSSNSYNYLSFDFLKKVIQNVYSKFRGDYSLSLELSDIVLLIFLFLIYITKIKKIMFDV